LVSAEEVIKAFFFFRCQKRFYLLHFFSLHYWFSYMFDTR
jgi:hypothetical protein